MGVRTAHPEVVRPPRRRSSERMSSEPMKSSNPALEA
jgi:hypothetical protein